MTAPDNTEDIKGNEDEISADADNLLEKGLPDDDSFKTSPRKNRLSWEKPLDEQMYESFDDIREQNPDGIKPGDEESD